MTKILTRQEFEEAKNELVEKKFTTLSKGYVQFIDAMGSDQRVVDAARTTSNVGGRNDAEDTNLIRFLLRHRHGTPFEMPHLLLKVVCPMDTWRQWIRHRTANVNEYSTRYSEVPDDNFDTTPPGAWRKQAESNRQGSSGEFVAEYPAGYDVLEGGPSVLLPTDMDVLDVVEDDETHRSLFTLYDGATAGDYLSEREKSLHVAARDVYKERLKFGVAKEQARKDLPLSTYTEAYWQCDLRNLIGFLSLRMDAHAQLEIRQYANIIGNEIVAKLWPTTWQAFLDYDLNSMRLTALDISVLQRLVAHAAAFQGIADNVNAPYDESDFMLCQHPSWKPFAKNRERDECLAKLRKLGLVAA